VPNNALQIVQTPTPVPIASAPATSDDSTVIEMPAGPMFNRWVSLTKRLAVHPTLEPEKRLLCELMVSALDLEPDLLAKRLGPRRAG
jgi:hypothetical protein